MTKRQRADASTWVLAVLAAADLLYIVVLFPGTWARNPPYQEFGALVWPKWVRCVGFCYVVLATSGASFLLIRGVWKKAACLAIMIVSALGLREHGRFIAAGAVADSCREAMRHVSLVRFRIRDGEPLPPLSELENQTFDRQAEGESSATPHRNLITLRPRQIPQAVFWAQPGTHVHGINELLVGRRSRDIKNAHQVPFYYDVNPDEFGSRRVIFADGEFGTISAGEWKRISDGTNLSTPPQYRSSSSGTE